jgi:hypothetical protein
MKINVVIPMEENGEGRGISWPFCTFTVHSEFNTDRTSAATPVLSRTTEQKFFALSPNSNHFTHS